MTENNKGSFLITGNAMLCKALRQFGFKTFSGLFIYSADCKANEPPKEKTPATSIAINLFLDCCGKFFSVKRVMPPTTKNITPNIIKIYFRPNLKDFIV